MDTPWVSAALQVGLGGVLVFITGVLIGKSHSLVAEGLVRYAEGRRRREHQIPGPVSAKSEERGDKEGISAW